MNGTENNYKNFQGQEITKELGLNWHLFKYRTYDASIGGFLQIDPMARGYEYNSTYAFAENKVTSGIDMEGLEQWYTTDGSLVTGVSGPLNSSLMNKVGLYTLDQLQAKQKQQRALQQLLDRTSSSVPQNTAKVSCNCALCYAKRSDPHMFLGYSMGSQIKDGMVIMTGDAMFAYALKGIGWLARSKSVWNLNRFERGRKIEDLLGGNLGWNFPVIDKLKNGVVTSIKSIDLSAKTYQKGNNLFNTLKKYINKVDDFSGANWGGQNIQEGVQFTEKAIELGINPNKATIGQWEQIGKAMDLAKEKGIDFTLKFLK